MTATVETTSLVNTPATEADVATTWAHIQYGDSWRLARLGARNRCYSNTGYVQFDVKVAPNKSRRVIVKLMANDTYGVEIGQLRRGEYRVLAQAFDVYADSLGVVIESLVADNR